MSYFKNNKDCKDAKYETIEDTSIVAQEEVSNAVTQEINVSECLCRINDIAGNICSSVTTWKEMDMQMHTMDIQFATFAKQMDVNLEMYKQRIPIVGKQLESINEMMNKILDKVLLMDAETEVEINCKMRLMDSVDTYVDKITTMMTSLL